MIYSFRASSLDRVFSCPGSITLVPLCPEPEDDECSSEGSLIHYLIAARLVTELGAIPPEGGLVHPKLPPGFALSPFASWIVDWAVRHVRERVPQGWSLYVELALDWEFPLLREIPTANAQGSGVWRSYLLTGHLDWFALSPEGTHSIAGDWKSGVIGSDPAYLSWQAGGYVALAKEAWPSITKMEFDLCQPRIDEEACGYERVTTATLEGGQLDSMSRVLTEHVTAALLNRFETDSGYKQCKYCPVAKTSPHKCPSIRAEMNHMKATITPETIESFKNASDGELGDFLMAGRTLSGPIEAAEDLVDERIKAQGYLDAANGVRITVKETKGSYEVPDPVAFFSRMRADLETDDRIALATKPSMTRLKDQIAEKYDIPKTSKKGDSADMRFESNYRPLVTQGVRRTKVFTS